MISPQNEVYLYLHTVAYNKYMFYLQRRAEVYMYY